MKMIATELADGLAALQYGIPTSPTLRQSECVIFQSQKAYTFSGDVFAITNTQLDLEGAVDYKNLMAVLRKYGSSEVDVELSSDTTLSIRRGRSQTRLPFDPAILLSIAAVASPVVDAWKPLPFVFSDAVKACESVAHAVHGDDVLSSINVTPTCMEAASTSQIIRYNCTLDLDSRFLVRAGLLGKLLRANVLEYQVVGRWLFLRSSDVTFAVPVYLDDFIDDIDTFLQPAQHLVTFPPELDADLSVVKSILTKDETMAVTLGNGLCTINADSVRGNHMAEFPMNTPVDLTFRISPDLLGRILVDFPDCTISSAGIRATNCMFSYAASVE